MHTFKSTVHHLFHGHTTHKDPNRFPIFNRHKEYTKEDWFEHLRRWYNWGEPVSGNIDTSKFSPYINETLLYVYKNSSKVRITMCMVNFLRYDVLIKNLENFLKLGVPMNMILWVNQSDNMPADVRQKVRLLMSQFNGHEIINSKKNMGTGYPRYMMFNKAKFEYNTDYIMTTDDDIFYQNTDSLVLGATMLDQSSLSDYGAVGLWCYPHYMIVRKKGDEIITEKPTEGFYTVDCLGAATMTIRRDVLDTCNCDPKYIVGLVDWDFSMSMCKQGYKLGLLCDERFKPVNDKSGDTDNYRDGRWDKNVIDNSKKLFKKKWKVKIK